ncbi:hypothetical protein ACFWBR_28800 [Streptomyces sp. NPDC060006]|uniref:hypothetical protein n=1 Tax=unclassified Streptomyces TaxID=2593676 RepID=UPI003689D3B7
MAYGLGQVDGAAGQGQVVVVEAAGVVQGQMADLGGAQGVEGEQGCDRSPRHVG